MKNIFKSLCFGLLLAFTVISVNLVKDVNAATKTKVTYKLDKGTLTVSGKGEMPKKMTFKENKKIKKVVIKNGITSIPKYAFSDCKKLKKVELPTTLKSIGEICFFGCSNVTVTIKGKITKCDVYAFYKVRNCKIVLKTAAAKKGKKVLAKALKKGKNKTVKIK